MTHYKLSAISDKNLNGVHQDLISVVRFALTLTSIDFRVIEGVRNMARQRQLVRNGKSQTLRSRHLTGHAVDIVPLINNQIPWENWRAFEHVACAMKVSAVELNIPVKWGGDWINFKDGPHYELCRLTYP